MGSPIVSGQTQRLKPPGKRIAVAIALLVGAVAVGWSQRGAMTEPRLLVLHRDETLNPAEIMVREIGGRPAGAPDGFEARQAFEITPIDPATSFTKPFTVNFYEKNTEGLVIILIRDGKWEQLSATRPWFSPVDIRVEGTLSGVYALGRLR